MFGLMLASGAALAAEPATIASADFSAPRCTVGQPCTFASPIFACDYAGAEKIAAAGSVKGGEVGAGLAGSTIKAVGWRTRQAEHLKEKHSLPTFKIGRIVCARRSSVEAWLVERGAEAHQAAEKSHQEAQDGHDAAERAGRGRQAACARPGTNAAPSRASG